MKFWKYTLPLIALLMMGSISATAGQKLAPKAYMFGFVGNFNDSIVYFTDIQTVDSVWYDKKTKFLMGRSRYSYQLREYFTEQMKKPNSTCVVIYALTRKDAEKKYVKFRNKYVGKKAGNYDIRNINENEFHFKSLDVSSEEESQPAAKAKKEKPKIRR